MEKNMCAENRAAALKTQSARKMMDNLAGIFERDARQKAKKLKSTKKDMAKRRALHNEARKLAFAHDTQLLGAGNRRISLSTGELVRRTSLYNEIPVEIPVLAVYHDKGGSSDNEDGLARKRLEPSLWKQKWTGVAKRATNIRSGNDFVTLGFEEQTKEDMQQLFQKLPREEKGKALRPMKGTALNSPKLNSRLMMQNHAADRLGMTAANSRFTQKHNRGQFQPTTPGARPPSRSWLPNPQLMRGLKMSPIRKPQVHPQSSSPFTLESLELSSTS
jgi:hypothetical protein